MHGIAPSEKADILCSYHTAIGAGLKSCTLCRTTDTVVPRTNAAFPVLTPHKCRYGKQRISEPTSEVLVNSQVARGTMWNGQ